MDIHHDYVPQSLISATPSLKHRYHPLHPIIERPTANDDKASMEGVEHEDGGWSGWAIKRRQLCADNS